MRRLVFLALLALAAVYLSTGIEVLQLALLGIALLLVLARLRVLALRRATPAAFRGAPRDEWAFPDPHAPAPTHLLPSTASARAHQRKRAASLEAARLPVRRV